MVSTISAKDVIKRFGNQIALQGVTLDFPEGVSALIGPNGAGKTTLIKIAVGKLKQDSGTITVLGSDDMMEIRSRVGIVHDKSAFPPEITVGFFLDKVAEIYGVDDNHSKSAIELCGLQEVRSQLIGTLSLGYGKRLGIAQAILHDPELIIADEPFAQLDPMTRLNLRDLFIQLYKEKGISSCISSHDIFDLEQIIDHYAIIKKGMIIREGSDFKISGVLIKGSNNSELKVHLQDEKFEVTDEGNMLRIEASFNDVLRSVINYKGTIIEIRSSSLESILREAIIE